MAEPTPPPAQTVAPLQWQLHHGQAPDGAKLCIVVLTQGLLTAQVVLSPHDTDALGRALIQGAAQARTGLIIPAGAVLPPPTPNGGT